ncbi:hypothetical protein EAG_02920, partial [Camponotus floridanus]
IEEELENIKSKIPSIPKKQFMQIEEVTEMYGIEEVSPTKIEEWEEIPQTKELKSEQSEKKHETLIKDQDKDMKQIPVTTITKEPLQENIEKIVLHLPQPEYKKPTEEKELKEQVTEEITEEVTEGKKPKKITKKKIIKGKQVTEEITAEEYRQSPVTTITEGPLEEIVIPTLQLEFAKPTKEEEIREEVTVTEEIVEGKKPKKIT